MLHNYRSRQLYRTSNDTNLSSGFKDMAKVLPDLTSFWPMGEPIWGKWANKYDVAQVQVLTIHETLNGVNPSSGFRGIRSAKSVWQIWQVFGPWASPYGANDHDSAQLQAYIIPQNFERRTSVKRLQRYGFRKSGSRPLGPWRQYPSSPEGWGIKSQWSVLLAFSVGNPLVTGEFLSQLTINEDIRTTSW